MGGRVGKDTFVPAAFRQGATATTAVAAAPVVVAFAGVVVGFLAVMKTWGRAVVLAGVSLRVHVS
ncbi:hypothetical protein [Arthrobacter alpinus]|uniref:hypothetical protein n=1 Tax=Arthrobacter alpinus TaxID=656366 RepID=UPI001114DD16|nr:hypothetical protein [Arthrobacter alpinus]